MPLFIVVGELTSSHINAKLNRCDANKSHFNPRLFGEVQRIIVAFVIIIFTFISAINT